MDSGFIQSKIGHIQPTMPNSIIKPEAIGADKTEETSFAGILKDSVRSIDALQKNANNQIQKLAKGEVQDVHQVTTAMQEASLTFKLMMKVRGQLLSAYKEISKGG